MMGHWNNVSSVSHYCNDIRYDTNEGPTLRLCYARSVGSLYIYLDISYVYQGKVIGWLLIQ
jgi:hypothetical protein